MAANGNDGPSTGTNVIGEHVEDRLHKHRLAWVYPDWLTDRLDSATWIETSRELIRRGWEVNLLSMNEQAGSINIRGVDTITFPARNVFLLGQLLFHVDIWRYLLDNWHDIDVVFFTQLSGFWMLPLRWARSLKGQGGPQIIMDTRDLDDPIPGSWRSKARISFHRMVFWMADVLADGQTAITKRMAELVKIPRDDLLGIWPSGVRPEEFSAALANRHWPGPDEPVHLMYIGILLERRNPVSLCQAVDRANASGMKFKLSLVGDGPAQSLVEPFIQSGRGNIRICAPIPHNQVPDLLADAHIGVTSLPDPDDVKYQASSPIKLFEYMAAGLPVLATSSACHTEVVGDGRFAYWAEDASEEALYDALSAIWADRATIARRGEEAQTAVHNWTWEAAGEKLHQALMKGLSET